MEAKDSSRTIRVVKQVTIGLVLRFGSVITIFVATPLMLQLLGAKQLGAWLVLMSVFQWITVFDLGVSAGARNEIARAAALKNPLHVRQAISTGWLYISIIAISLLIVVASVLLLTSLPEWLENKVFGGVDVTEAVWVVTVGACIAFAIGYIQIAFAALERATAFSLFFFLANFFFLIFLVLGKWVSTSDIGVIARLYLLANLVGNAWLIYRFFKDYPEYRPAWNVINHELRSRIVGVGIRIFLIQLAALIVFCSSRVMVSAILGPESVVIYDAGFKLFSVVTMIHSLIMTTLWSSFTQAYTRGELSWIKKSLIRLLQLMLPVTIGSVILAQLSPWIIEWWMGPEQVGSSVFYALFAAVTVLSCWSNIFSYFLNGIGDTSIQLVSAILASIINIPATYYFTVTAEWGIHGVLMGTLVSLSFFSILGPVQTFLKIRNKSV